MNDRAMQAWAARFRGSRRWTEGDAREVLDKQKASGDEVTVFAHRAGLTPQRLFWWRSRLGMAGGREAQSQTSPVGAGWVPVVVRDAARPWGGQAPLVVRIGEGVQVEVHQADEVTAAWVAMVAAQVPGGVR